MLKNEDVILPFAYMSSSAISGLKLTEHKLPNHSTYQGETKTDREERGSFYCEVPSSSDYLLAKRYLLQIAKSPYQSRQKMLSCERI